MIRTTGFGGALNEPLAATAGTLASFGLTPGSSGATNKVLGAGNTVKDYLAGADIQTNVVPAAEKIFQNNVTKFTPEIKQVAQGEGVAPEVIAHIEARTPAQVEASSAAMQHNPGAVEQILKDSLAKQDQAVSQAYDSAWNGVPKNQYIALPKTQAATTKFLQDSKIIDNVGNLTEYGKQALGDDAALNKVYQNHLLMGGDSGAASTIASRANVAPVNQAQWTLLRNNFNRARNSANYGSPITDLLDSLHADAMDAGVNIQPARELAAQNFANEALAKPFISVAGGENKFKNIFKLNDDQMANLQQLDKNFGTNMVQRAQDIAAAGPQGLAKVRALGVSNGSRYPSAINTLIQQNASINPLAWKESVQSGNELKELLGKSPAVNSLLGGLLKRRVVVGGLEVGGAAVGKNIYDRVTGN